MAPGFARAVFERAGRRGRQVGGAVDEGFGALGHECEVCGGKWWGRGV